MSVQTIISPSGEELVVLSRRDYDALLAQLGDEAAEDRMTLLLAAEARAEATLPSEISDAILKGQSLLKALRVWRCLTQMQVAEKADLNQGFLSELENRTKSASPDTLTRLALALDVPAAWLS